MYLQSDSAFITGKDNLLRNVDYGLGHFLICVSLKGFPELQIPTDLWDLRGGLVHLLLLLAFLRPAPTTGLVFSFPFIYVPLRAIPWTTFSYRLHS